ncbi:MAG: hypothetical protein EZS28_037756 [Streblomastix strix]|uniref:Uncharacterized protein n=1 Tax=Streblomastix strix TaxID=222440 RepID=A0A5J4U8P0_9EUKA|nr:MAG: hypothetical protein EZS28_037756 [Streblomastix strix]
MLPPEGFVVPDNNTADYRWDFNYRNLTFYQDQQIPKRIKNTMVDLVPARGEGQFNTHDARTWGLLGCCFGCPGCQRWYVGERQNCCKYCCLGWWTCCIAQCYDLCKIKNRVTRINQDVRQIAHQGYDARANAARAQAEYSTSFPPLNTFPAGSMY